MLRRCFDVIMTLLLHNASAGYVLITLSGLLDKYSINQTVDWRMKWRGLNVREPDVVKTHWILATHIYAVVKWVIIASGNGLSLMWHQAVVWTTAGLFLIGSLRTNFSEIRTKNVYIFRQDIEVEISSAKWRPFCLGFNILNLVTVYLLWTFPSTV